MSAEPTLPKSDEFVCYHCKANDCGNCVGIPCMCDCPDPPTAKEFWGTLFGTGPEYADANMCSFAEHYAAYVTAERERELQQAKFSQNVWENIAADWEGVARAKEKSLSEAREELVRLKVCAETLIEWASHHPMDSQLQAMRKIAQEALAVPEKPDTKL